MIRILRASSALWRRVHRDLDRPHEFAFERVGFLFCREARSPDGLALIAADYRGVEDSHYLESHDVGALVGADGIREAMQHAYREQYAVMHVHRHEHHGDPWFSPIDMSENAKLIPTFWNVVPKTAHGALLLSFDRARAEIWDPADRTSRPLDAINVVGQRIEEFYA